MNDRISDGDQLDAMRRSLASKPSELPVSALMPVLVPSSFFEVGNWPGPYTILEVPGLALTWAFEQPAQTMLYLSHEVAEFWKASQRDWAAESMLNLRRRAASGICTGIFPRGGSDSAYFAAVFMHEDGFGPSRLLLGSELQSLFPNGYTVGLPEMSCGFALSSDATNEERSRIEAVVEKCYNEGSRPLVSGIHDPSLLRERAGPSVFRQDV